MLFSMTGFGASEITSEHHRIKVEVKSLNSKFLDITHKLPRELADKELEIKLLLGQELKRGKINLVIELTPVSGITPGAAVNEPLLKSYFELYQKLCLDLGADTNDLFRLALQAPEVMTSDGNTSDVSWEMVEKALKEAIIQCNQFRQQEGSNLHQKIGEYIDAIRNGLEEVIKRDPQRIVQIRERISANLEELKERVQIDPNRFEQELIYYTEKLDITEEKVRLARHLDYFMEVMGHGELQGKKLGFISQEIGREINTIGSKANDSVIQREVVQMKDELEKIKEQSMNIL